MSRDQFWLTKAQFSKIKPHLPTDTRGKARVDDRRVISGIVQVLKSGARWVDAPPEYGPRKTLYKGNGLDQGDQEGRCGNTIGFFGKLDEGELRSSVDRHEEVELSLGGLHFGDVDVEEADRIRLELFLCRLVALDLSKTADPMPLQTTMQ